MKRFVAIVALCLTINPAVKPNQHANKSKAPGDKEREPSVVISNNQKTTDQTYSKAQETPKWYRTINWSNWALVLVAILTAWAVFKQARDTACAARATNRAVELQAKQWIDILGWGINTDVKEGKSYVLNFQFDILNKTKFPLTLKDVSVAIGKSGVLETCDSVLAPDCRYTVIVPVQLTEAQTRTFLERKAVLRFPVLGTVNFIDVLEKPNAQRFEGAVSYIAGVVEFVSRQPAKDDET